MRKNALLSVAAALLLVPSAVTAASSPHLGVVGIARYHQGHTAVREWPYDKGDMSYGASLLLYDGIGYIELGCEYSPEPSADEEDDDTEILDEVFTPFARMVIKQFFVSAGFGVRDNYVLFTDSDRKDDWTDLLYEFHLGLEFTLGPVVVGGGAYYSFDDWKDLDCFDVDDLEYGVHAGFCF